MLVVDDVRDHHIPNASVERRGFAQDIDSLQLISRHPNLSHDVVRGEAKGIIHVDDDRVRLSRVEADAVVRAKPGIELRWVELG
jgi:hypothetical protein